MKRLFQSLPVAALLALCSVPQASAADLYSGPGELYQPSTLRGSIGLRYWYSKSRSDLDNSGFDISSTDNVTSNTAELVGTLEDTTANTFVRGYVGLGRSNGGDVHFAGYEMDSTDETTLGYVVIDGGWGFAQFANNQVRLKGFLGYQYLSDDVSAKYGSLTVEQSRDWHAIRLGMTAEGDLGQRVGWSVDVAGVPWSYNKIETWESDWTYGLEADAMLNVDLTQNWQLGVGGRYWWLHSNFDRRLVTTGEKVVLDQNYHRYGLLLESKYTF
ncbi:hypothetical protein V1T76_00895 [Roseibium sp. FZY0029]|uniref:hypothetical protein n=1 Tax=Roseibium sp. FZY0029 TaxID=3116647 RepID=UPI002EA29A4C|nr:hypothetical protein [Roseibium sp. FZY0029]